MSRPPFPSPDLPHPQPQGRGYWHRYLLFSMTEALNLNHSLTLNTIGAAIAGDAIRLRQTDEQQRAAPPSKTTRSTGKLGDADFYARYRQINAEAELRLSDEVEDPTPCLEITDGTDSKVFGTLGNFSLIVGKAKSRKTFMLSVLVAAFIKDGTVQNKVRGIRPNQKATVLYFDTEQHGGHLKRVMRRISLLADDEQLQNVRFFRLRKYAPHDRLNAIKVAMEDTDNLGLVVIDGISDTVFDINDVKEAVDRATDLLQWTGERELHLITVIHENKGNANARGHLGSELIRKAETVISVSIDPAEKQISVVTPEHCRDKAFEPFAFSVDENGLPYSIEEVLEASRPAGRARKPKADDLTQEEVQMILRRVFSNAEQLRYREFQVSISEASEFIGKALARTPAEKLIIRVEKDKHVRKVKPYGSRYEVYQLCSTPFTQQPN